MYAIAASALGGGASLASLSRNNRVHFPESVSKKSRKMKIKQKNENITNQYWTPKHRSAKPLRISSHCHQKWQSGSRLSLWLLSQSVESDFGQSMCRPKLQHLWMKSRLNKFPVINHLISNMNKFNTHAPRPCVCCCISHTRCATSNHQILANRYICCAMLGRRILDRKWRNLPFVVGSFDDAFGFWI